MGEKADGLRVVCVASSIPVRAVRLENLPESLRSIDATEAPSGAAKTDETDAKQQAATTRANAPQRYTLMRPSPFTS